MNTNTEYRQDFKERIMKKVKYILALAVVVFMAAALVFGIKNDAAPEKVFDEMVLMPGGTWVEERTEQGEVVQYEYDIPESEDEKEWVLVLKSHWQDFEIFTESRSIFKTGEKHTGAIHMFAVPTGERLTIQFFNASDRSISAIEQSKVWIGNRTGIYRMILLENLHVGIFAVFALVLGVISIFLGIYMRSTWSRQMCQGLRSLGYFILDTGVWILTDSKLLLLFTQKTGVVELISFLAFFTLGIPLLEFTKKMMPGKEKLFGILQALFAVQFIVYCVNYMTEILSLTIVLMTEHLLMAAAIGLVLYGGFSRMRQRRNKKIMRIMVGYIIFSVCSVVAFVFFYQGNTMQYSIAYVVGILGFVFFLADAACISIYEQIRENANVTMYAKMAYTDMMTGLGNRAAFIEDSRKDETFSGAVAYIMIDANNLKKINDSLGHKRGDELLTTVSRCVEDGVKHTIGNGRCYRIGGDEFVIRLRNATRQDAEDCIRHVREALAEANKKTDIPISAAMGYTWSDEAVKDTEKLLQHADTEMYENKQMMKRQSQNMTAS